MDRDVAPLSEAELTSLERSVAMAPLSVEACRRLIATVRALQARQRHPAAATHRRPVQR